VIVYFILLLLSMGLLVREILILSGLLKDPILRGFQKYGDTEAVYRPLPSLLTWAGLLLLALGAIAAPVLGSSLPLALPGGLLLALALWRRLHAGLVRRFPHILLRYPRWYADLRERTSRYERRRLAYLWLTLPWQLRLRYNGSDRAFDHWADLVIMATMRYDEAASLGDHVGEFSVWDL
jgi:hypothetical protein